MAGVVEERLQKIIARHGVASRREAEKLIVAGCVTVNGQRVTELGAKANAAKDAIKVNGKLLHRPPALAYWLLYKPKGLITSRQDPEGRPTVFDLLKPGIAAGLFAVGRLDFNTEGLLILTNDGDLAERLTHPSYGCEKTYEVKVSGVPDEAALQRLRGGIPLEGRQTRPAHVQTLRVTRDSSKDPHNAWLLVRLREGRQNQIRRMLERVGHPVQKLKRIAIGPLKARHMRAGDLRALTPAEVDTLRRSGDAVAMPPEEAASPRKKAGHWRPWNPAAAETRIARIKSYKKPAERNKTAQTPATAERPADRSKATRKPAERSKTAKKPATTKWPAERSKTAKRPTERSKTAKRPTERSKTAKHKRPFAKSKGVDRRGSHAGSPARRRDGRS